jgi:hypothetical protein
MRESQCPVCLRKILRNKYGQLLPHTRLELGPDAPVAVVCEAYTRGARAT